MTPLRISIIRDVLEAAGDCEDFHVISACRRLLWADILGWRKHHNPDDYRLVMAFAE